MNAKQVAVKVNRNYKADNKMPMTEDGYRLRVTTECKALGPEYIEAGATYFYRIQGRPGHVREIVETYAPGVTLEAVGTVNYNDRPWPKDSWAVQIFKIIVND